MCARRGAEEVMAPMPAMRHAILGAGGVGGLIGACLARSGNSVTLVVRRETLQQYPRQLRLESRYGNFTVDVGVAAEVPARGCVVAYREGDAVGGGAEGHQES